MDAEAAQDISESLPGTVLDGRVRIHSFLAKGGMGLIFRGTEVGTDRPLAVKVLVALRDDPLFRRRFFNEATLCASLTNPHVVEIVHYGVADGGHCYIAMELLEGVTLARYLKDSPRVPIPAALHMVRQLCSALGAAHARGFVHRDLKPSNVFVVDGDSQPGPTIKLLDFGLAKRTQVDQDLTQTGTFLGSPSYMSPEQIAEGRIGPPSDVYNVGLLLTRMVTGRNPFKRDSATATLVAHATQPPPPFSALAPDLPPDPLLAEVERIVMTCLQKAPADRYPSIADLDRACAALLGQATSAPAPPRRVQQRSDPAPAPRPLSRWALALLSALLLGGLALIVVLSVAIGWTLAQG